TGVVDGDGDAAFVDESVVMLAQQQQIVDVGRAAVQPGDDVVHLEPTSAGTCGERAVTVAEHQRPPLCTGPISFRSPDMQWVSVETSDDRLDIGLTAQASCRGGLDAGNATDRATALT